MTFYISLRFFCSRELTLFWIGQRKPSKCPENTRNEWIDEWINKMLFVYTHTMEYYSAVKKNKTLPFAATWVDLEDIMLCEINQTEKDKYYT